MRSLSGFLLGAALLSAIAGTSAQAMPITPAPDVAGSAAVILVRDGCGPFGHRSHYGYCKPNGPGRGPGFYGPGPYYGGPGYGPRRFYGGGYERRCFIRDTYYGPRRICR